MLSTISKEKIFVGSNAIGEEVYITKFTVDSGIKGKTIYIQGGIHGGEVTLHIIRKLCDYLVNNLKSGRVIFVPFANPNAWKQKSYSYTVGKFSKVDGVDFNRCFGKKSTELNCKIANILLEIAKQSDFALDLHTAMTSMPYSIFLVPEYIEYVRLLNIDYNYLCPISEEFLNTFDVQLYLSKVPNFVIECGSHDEINETNQKRIVEGILNIFKYFGLVEGNPLLSKRFSYFTKATSINAPIGGIILFERKLNEKINKNDIVARLLSGDLTKEEIRIESPCDGFIFRCSKTHILDEGGEIMKIINTKDIKTVSF